MLNAHFVPSRWLMGLLAVVLTAFVVTGCGDSNGSNEEDAITDLTTDTPVDVPIDPSAVPIGASCEDETVCNGGICATLLPGGYCTDTCDTVECPTGSTCSIINEFPFCMKTCGDSAECRTEDGYSCVAGLCDIECDVAADCGSGEICANHVCTVRPTGNLAVGVDCTASADCASGYCLDALDGGVCSEPCTPGCSIQGWTCRPLSPLDSEESLNLCGPGGEFVAEVIIPDGNNPFTFTAQTDVVSFMIVVESTNPIGSLIIQNITAPDGSQYSRDANQNGYTEPFQLTPSIGHSTAMVPQNNNPSLQMQAGEWSFDLAGDFNAQIGDVQVFLKRKTGGGMVESGTFNLNVYIPSGAFNGINAGTAATSSRVQGAIDRMRTHWSPHGLQVGTINYYDIAASYGVLADYNELIDARAQGSIGEPGALDVFFVRDVLGQGAAGIAGGIPGPVGVQGTGGSGVVVELYQNGRMSGDNMTHELGHFLSFYHVTEAEFMIHDVIGDTAQCSRTPYELLNAGQYDPCMDNLMFPVLITDGGVPQGLSNTQGQIARLNPQAN